MKQILYFPFFLNMTIFSKIIAIHLDRVRNDFITMNKPNTPSQICGIFIHMR